MKEKTARRIMRKLDWRIKRANTMIQGLNSGEKKEYQKALKTLTK